MRLSVGFLFLSLATFGFAQDTKFSTGPQYLMTADPMFLHSIATPSLSLGEALPPVPNASETEVVPSLQTSSSVGPGSAFFGGVYWGDHTTAEIIGHRLTTPTMTPDEIVSNQLAAGNTAANAPSATATPEGPTTSSVIEITSAQIPANLPASIIDTGVTGMTDAQSLRDRGYGVSLGEVAAHWKAHKRTGKHVFTNDDLHRN